MNLRMFGRSGSSGSLSSTYQSVREAAAQAQRARVPQMAAALSYRTIFGLLPVVIVALVLLKAFTSPSDLEGLIKAVLAKTGITAIVVDQGEAPPTEPTTVAPGTAPALQSGLDVPEALRPAPLEPQSTPERSAGPAFDPKAQRSFAFDWSAEPVGTAAARRLDDWVGELIRRVNSISLPALGLIGMGALLYAAIGMLVEIERAFNQVYRSPQGRPWPSRVVLYWALMTLGPLALFATFYVGSQARSLTERLVLSMPGASGEWGAVGVIIVGYLSTVLISGGVLLLLYMAVPWAKVALRPAIVGALVAAIAWEASKWGFAQYITFTRGQSYVRLYGSVALVPLFLLWVYVTWIVVLSGLQVAFYLQHGRRAGERELAGVGVTNPAAAAVAILHAMAQRFKEGKASSPMQLSRDLRLPFSGNTSAVGEVLDRLESAGFVHQLARARSKADVTGADDDDAPEAAKSRRAGSADTNGTVRAVRADDPRWQGSWGLMRRRYALARPPENVRLAAVVDAMLDHTIATASSLGNPLDSPLLTARRLRDAQVQAMGERTLADLSASG